MLYLLQKEQHKNTFDPITHNTTRIIINNNKDKLIISIIIIINYILLLVVVSSNNKIKKNNTTTTTTKKAKCQTPIHATAYLLPGAVITNRHAQVPPFLAHAVPNEWHSTFLIVRLI